MAKVAEVAPDATVTLGGTDTALLALDSATARAAVAAAVNVTVPVVPLPPTTVVGLATIDASDGAAVTVGFQPSWTTSKSLGAQQRERGIEDVVVPARVERAGDVHVRAVVGDDESVLLHRAEDLLHVRVGGAQRGILARRRSSSDAAARPSAARPRCCRRGATPDTRSRWCCAR